MNDYPSNSEEVEFTALKRGKATLVTEIDQFEGSSVPVGQIFSIIANDSCIYVTDSQKGLVHVLDRKSYHYKHSIGSSVLGDPSSIYRPYGAQFYQGNLLVGNSHGRSILKMFALSGEYLTDYAATEVWYEGFAPHLNNFLVTDSTVYIVKMVADNGFKVRRARLENNGAKILPDVVKVSELNVKVDSAIARKIITRLYLLKSNMLDTTFFAIPSNKYLINRYSTTTGQLLESTSLLGISEFRESFEFNTVLNNLFFSAAIDERDNIYIPVQEVIDTQAFKAGDFSDNNVKTFFSAVGIDDKTYRLYQLDKSRSVAPICFIDGRLWCYDFVMSTLLIYSLQ